MKLLTEYIERALQFEKFAEGEDDPELKPALLTQASAYRNLAAKRAAQYGLPLPSPPETEDEGA